MNNDTCRYRIDDSTETIYEWSDEQDAYLFSVNFIALEDSEIEYYKHYIRLHDRTWTNPNT